MRIILVLAIFLLGCGENSTATPANTVGVMWQSAAKADQSCDWLEIFDGVKPNLSFLYDSYGKDPTCLHRLFSLHPDSTIRIYLSNGVCLRKDNCSPLEARSHSDAQSNFKGALKLTDDCPTCKFIFLPQLEDNYTEVEACRISWQLSKIDSRFEIWRNPVEQQDINNYADCFDGVELHNETPRSDQLPVAWSNDGRALLLGGYNFSGLSISADEVRRIRGSLGWDVLTILWHPAGNCLQGDTLNAPYPYARKCESNKQIYSELNKLIKDLQ